MLFISKYGPLAITFPRVFQHYHIINTYDFYDHEVGITTRVSFVIQNSNVMEWLILVRDTGVTQGTVIGILRGRGFGIL